ncbi:hypothetical protein [Bacillus toyonensis]|uniref:hypothetical protein n=1 Tax=Bacillus toyonensis TaxID=155322 RepID=UPI000BF51E5A|nr:hypothetical protein [Bacillus toyonensis]PFY80044.1 hypothetical protein COL59_28495 [Bacillus toyonensis]
MRLVDLASALHSKYGDGARYMFESLCGALILDESLYKKTNVFKFAKDGQVFSIAVSKGDGGLDIVHQSGDEWIVFQCKFLFKISLGQSDYKNSFDTALKTAKEHSKKIKKWVLCIPKDLSPKEFKDWEEFKAENKKLVSQIELIPQNILISTLNQNINIRDLYVTSSVNSITMSLPIKKGDRIILEKVLDQIENKKILKMLKLATGYDNTSYVYIDTSSLRNFQKFVATLTKMRNDFEDYIAFEVYNAFRENCKEFIEYFSWAYKNTPMKDKQNLYLGYDVNPMFRTYLSDSYIYNERLKKAEQLYDNFIEVLENLDSYYKNNAIISN